MRLRSVLLPALALGSAASAQTITSLATMTPYAVSDDGTAACGIVGQFAYWWTDSNGAQVLPGLPGHVASYAIAANHDGSVFAGYSQLTEQSAPVAVRWAAGGVQDLGQLQSSSTAANAVSGDGAIVVGQSGTLAFRWTQATGMQSLGLLAGWTSANATAISAEGSIIVGFAGASGGPRLFRHVGGALEELAALSGTAVSAVGVSDDGQVIAGRSNSRLYRWTQAGGLQDLGLLPGYTTMTPTGMSADGGLIVGYATQIPGFSNEPFVWTEATGLTGLAGYLTGAGVNLSGWTLRFVFDLSDDGTAMVGLGTLNGQEQGWIVRLAPATGCYANCDASTQAPVLNVQDFTCFLQRYAAGDSYANCDQSTQAPVLNVQDFTCFLQRYASGCP